VTGATLVREIGSNPTTQGRIDEPHARAPGDPRNLRDLVHILTARHEAKLLICELTSSARNASNA
jgi:hypothetical protein